MHSSLNNSAVHQISFYPAWCKRCGSCIAFCPRGALAGDAWGRPFLAAPGRCTGCGLCEMLCPDFAISLTQENEAAAGEGRSFRPGAASLPDAGPERLAPAPGRQGS